LEIDLFKNTKTFHPLNMKIKTLQAINIYNK